MGAAISLPKKGGGLHNKKVFAGKNPIVCKIGAKIGAGVNLKSIVLALFVLP